MYRCHSNCRKRTFWTQLMSATLLKFNEIDPFLKWIVTNNEKWITYENTSWQSRGPRMGGGPIQKITKPELTTKKVEGNHQLYTDHTEAGDRPETPKIGQLSMVYSIKITPGHTSLTELQKLWELKWKVLWHPPYRPDLAPSDYHLLQDLQFFDLFFWWCEKSFSRKACKNELSQIFRQ